MKPMFLHSDEGVTKSMLLYSADDLFRHKCQIKFNNLSKIDATPSTQVIESWIEMNSYNIAIFDILYTGQCDNLIRYLHDTNTRIIVIVMTWKQERYYTSSQRVLGIKQVFKKPITSEYYDFIFNEIDKKC